MSPVDLKQCQCRMSLSLINAHVVRQVAPCPFFENHVACQIIHTSQRLHKWCKNEGGLTQKLKKNVETFNAKLL